MKKIILLVGSVCLFASCGWHKIGTLTVASTRNHESKAEYVVLQTYTSAKVKAKGKEVLQDAIDEAVRKVPGGEFMKNVKFYVKSNGKKIKGEGDVWGLPVTTQAK